MNFQPFGKNILFEPQSKNKIIGDTSKYFLFGKVIAVGGEVKNIKVGQIIAFTQWALNKVILPNKAELFFCKEDDDFVLGVSDEA